MKSSSRLATLAIAFALPAAMASDATTPIDYTQRNNPFAVQPGVSPSRSSPSKNQTIQDARVEKDVRDKVISPVGDKRARVELVETREKNVVEKDSRRPERTEQPVSAMNQRKATVSTAQDTRKPPLVAKYQDSLAAASATNMARFPAMDGGTKATINRFVFRKNAPETAPTAPQASSTPAAGGSPVRR